MTALAYPRLIKRIRAVLIDSIVVPVIVFSVLLIGDSLGVSGVTGKALLIAVPIFLLEPGLIAFSGGTIGHHLLGIRVTKRDGLRNINVLAACVRFVVKLLLGWLSFIFVLTTAKHQAVHDLVAGSIVIHRDPAGLPVHELLSERKPETDAYVYPGALHRVAVIFAYWVLVMLALGLISHALLSPECLRGRSCTTFDHLVSLGLNICGLLGLGWITVRGWGGELSGCMRRPVDATKVEPD